MPVSNGIKLKGTSIEVPGFNVPIILSDIPHHAIESLDSKLNNKSILLSLTINNQNCSRMHLFFITNYDKKKYKKK